MTDTLVSRISKLLAKAESTESTAEAAALFAKAQELCTTHSIDMALAHHHRTQQETPDVLEERSLFIGKARTDNLKQKVQLWGAVADNNTVRYSIAHNSTTVHPIGYTTDLDMAESLYAVLVEQMVRLGNEYLDRGEWRGDTYRKAELQPRGFWDVVEKPVTKRMARRSFYSGFILAVASRLREAKDETVAKRVAADEARDATLPSVTSLALIDRKQAVDEFTQRAFKRNGVRGSWKRPSGGRHNRSHTAGHAAGQKAVLSGRKSIG